MGTPGTPSTVVDGQSYTEGTNTNNTAATHVPRGGTWGGSRFTASASFSLTEAGSYYWSSSENNISAANCFYYASLFINLQVNLDKFYGTALRCVRDN